MIYIKQIIMKRTYKIKNNTPEKVKKNTNDIMVGRFLM